MKETRTWDLYDFSPPDETQPNHQIDVKLKEIIYLQEYLNGFDVPIKCGDTNFFDLVDNRKEVKVMITPFLKEYDHDAELILRYVEEKHRNMIDKGGQAYIGHLYRVSCNGCSFWELLVGILHDIIEDTDTTIEELRSFLTGKVEDEDLDVIIPSINLLTKKKGLSYNDYILNISRDKLATAVKLNDLEDNMDLTRLGEEYTMTPNDESRQLKYTESYKLLFGVLYGNKSPTTCNG